MFCPACGVENNQQNTRFCRACGADLRAVSQALSKSLPVKIASTIDTYLENRYQQNMRTGVMNLIAFVALLVVGLGQLAFGWPKLAVFMLDLARCPCCSACGTSGSIGATSLRLQKILCFPQVLLPPN
jgi:hypothetical protein